MQALHLGDEAPGDEVQVAGAHHDDRVDDDDVLAVLLQRVLRAALGEVLAVTVGELVRQQVEACRLVGGAAVPPQAERGGAAGEDHAAHARFTRGFQYATRALDVDRHHAPALLAPVGRDRRDVEHQFAARAGRRQRLALEHVADDRLEIQALQGVHARAAPMQHAHFVAGLHQRARHVRADEAGAAGNEGFQLALRGQSGADGRLRVSGQRRECMCPV